MKKENKITGIPKPPDTTENRLVNEESFSHDLPDSERDKER